MALNFPSGQPDGTVWTDPNGEQWVYNAAENSWTSKGLVNETGGLKYKGGLDITAAPPTAEAGEFWSVETGGTANAGFGPGVTGNVDAGSLILYDGVEWDLINVSPYWNRTNGTITPVNATDVIHGQSGVRVGPGSEIELNADGSAAATSYTANNTPNNTYIFQSVASSADFGGLFKESGGLKLNLNNSSAVTNIVLNGDDGSAEFAGGDITLNADGSASFANGHVNIDSSGRLLVGTTTSIDSTSKVQIKDGYLNVYHDSSADQAGYGIRFSTNGGATGRAHARISLSQSAGAGGNLLFSTTADGASSPTERMRIDSNGLVNITGGIQVTENVAPTSGYGIEIFTPSSTVGQVQAFNRAGNTWMDLITKGNTQQFYANNAEAMRIDSSGNLKLGGTLPSSPSISLNTDGSAHFVGDVTSDGTIGFNLEADNPDNYTTTTEEYEDTIRVPIIGGVGTADLVDGEPQRFEEKTVTKTREIKTYTGPVLDVKAELQALRERATQQDAVIAEMQAQLKLLKGSTGTQES